MSSRASAILPVLSLMERGLVSDARIVCIAPIFSTGADENGQVTTEITVDASGSPKLVTTSFKGFYAESNCLVTSVSITCIPGHDARDQQLLEYVRTFHVHVHVK